MIRNGKVLKSDSGHRIRVGGLLKPGGQGEAYSATEIDSGQNVVLKTFHQQFANGDTLKRLRFLAKQDLSTACPVLCSPIDVMSQGGMVGHYSPLAPGRPLEEYLANPNSSFLEGLQLAIALTHALEVMHTRQIAHGDLHADNLIVNQTGSVFELSLIDFDNFNAPGVPIPPMLGQNLYLAPELREAIGNRQAAVPNIYTDRFALGVLMHEIILLRHVAAGADGNEADFQKAMCAGRWIQDPAAADRPAGDLGGYPVEVINADLARLFRLALSLDPASRPSPGTWKSELLKALNSVYCCPKCGGPCIVDMSKVKCPLCGQPFPHLTMKIVATGHILSLVSGTIVIGRMELGGSMKVSERHAVFHRIGPETWLESHGRNGTYRWNGSGWPRLPDMKPLLVQSGDRLKFGDVEVLLN